MKQFLITPQDLIKFMGTKKYRFFINYLRNENDIPKNEAIWIIGEWSAPQDEEE